MSDEPIFVPYSGPTDARIMVIGESPGKQEVLERQPFVGPAGRLLRDALRAAGINPADVRFCNLSHLRPPRDDLSVWITNGLPSEQPLLAGMHSLREDVRQVRPNVVITVGAFATAFCTNASLHWDRKLKSFTGIGEWRGSILNGSPFLGVDQKCVATYHPSYIQRGAFSDYPWLVFDLARALEQSLFSEIRRPQVELIIDPRGADRLDVERRLLSTGDAITFDIEYSRRSRKLYCIGFTSGPGWAATIPIRSPEDLEFCRRILLSGRPLVAQNAMFDCSILEWHYNIPVMQYLAYDTMIAAHALNIEFPKDLGFLCRQYTEQPNYWSQFDGAYWNALDRETDPFKREAAIAAHFAYNATDTWVTAAVRAEQLTELDTPGLQWTNAHEMALVSALWDVSKRGCRIDLEKMAALTAECNDVIAAGMKHLSWFNDDAPVNVKSPVQVTNLLRRVGVKLTKKTPGGKQFKTDDTTLAEAALLLKDDERGGLARAVIKLIRSIRKSRDLISKFCEIELDADKRMRCHYDPAKTDTGRLSSRIFYPTGVGANLQNIPKDRRARSVFIADKGMEFGYADLERAESLVVAHISGDDELLRVHSHGIDAHLSVASIIFERDYDDLRAAYKSGDKVAEDQRYLGKKVGHSGNYMRGWKRLQTLVNQDAQKTGIAISAAEAKRYTDLYRSSRPGLVRWWNDTAATLRRTRTLFNLLGRRRVFYDRLDSILPNAIAFVPQSTVGDSLNVGVLNVQGLPQNGRSILSASGYYQPELSRQLRELGFEMLLQVHDAIGFQYPERNRDTVLPIVRRALAVPLTNPRNRETFTIPVEILIGPNWGDTKPYIDDLAS
mgnify:FL=1